MRIRESLPIKSHYNAPYIYGRYYSAIYARKEIEEQKHINNISIKAKRKTKLKELISFFRQYFCTSNDIMVLIEELFQTWEKQQYNKEIPQAMIQIENVMKANGYIEEYKIWNSKVFEKFSEE